MNKLYVSPEAQNDSKEIRQYISEELENEAVADNTVRKIIERIRQLEEHGLLGAPLDSVVDAKSDYRYLVCGSYLVFYRAYKIDVYIDRVLYGRRDYIPVLFGQLKDE
jgi:addiction module RelE/StbE family toxin